jgi:hypothetical protein
VDHSNEPGLSDELIEQLNEASLMLDTINQRINSIYSFQEQADLKLITEETSPAIDKARKTDNWKLAENIQADQSSKQKEVLDVQGNDRKSRDEMNRAFMDRLVKFVAAHSHDGQTQLAIVARESAGSEASGPNPTAQAQVVQGQDSAEDVSEMFHKLGTSVVNNEACF